MQRIATKIISCVDGGNEANYNGICASDFADHEYLPI